MSEGSTRSGGRSGAGDGTDGGTGGGGDTGQPTLREFVSHRISDLFTRLDGEECDGLYRMVIGEVEGSLLEAVMKEAEGNQGRAARILGLNRGTLRRKLRAHGLIPQGAQPTGGGGG